MPRGGSRKNSGRKPRDIFDPMNLWVIDRVRFHLAQGEKLRNERWQRKNIKTKVFNEVDDAKELYAKIEELNLRRKLLHSLLEKECALKGVTKLTETDSANVRQLKNAEIKLAEVYESLKYIFSNNVPGGGLLTPIPLPSNRDMTKAFASVVSDAKNHHSQTLTLRQVKDVWAAWNAFEGSLSTTD